MRIRPICAAALLTVVALSWACSAHRPAAAPLATVLTSLQASVARDSAHFLLQITNAGTEPAALELITDPAVYFTVARDQLPVWSSAPDLTRMDPPVSDTLRTGETRSFRASWALPMGLRGTMTVTGVLRDRRGPVVQSTEFEIQ